MINLQKPNKREKLIDLVSAAGFDVSDWCNTKGNASSNPKYCYEWSFVNDNDSIILNLWYEELENNEGVFYQRIDLKNIMGQQGIPLIKRRAKKMFEAVGLAYEKKLPVRVIVLAGKLSDYSDKEEDSPVVEYRYLDSEIWSITEYNKNNLTAVVTRKYGETRYYDQFSIPDTPLLKKTVVSQAFQRSQRVRDYVFGRADGKCEYCGNNGFRMLNGGVYLETHHINPLSEKGRDAVDNVIGLCANDHRLAHHSIDKLQIKNKMIELIRGKRKKI